MILSLAGEGWSIQPCVRWLIEQQNESGGFWYVGSPYSKYPDGLHAAFREVSRITGSLIAQGVHCYSPIAHTHPVAIHSGMDPLDHSIWLAADAPLMRAAIGLIVCKMESWEKSYGLKVEIEEFERAEKPIVYLEP